MTNKEQITKELLTATQLYNAAADHKEANQRYKLLCETLQRYHKTLWGKPERSHDN
jgi:hypothetical protein